MLNRSASLAMSTSILKALPGKLDIKDTHLVFSIHKIAASLCLIRSAGTLVDAYLNGSYIFKMIK